MESLGQITNKEGAGVADAINALNAFGNAAYYNTTDKTITYKFTPDSSGMKNVAITWFKQVEASGLIHYNNPSLSSYGFVNFDLYVLDSSGKEIASSTSSNNNVSNEDIIQ